AHDHDAAQIHRCQMAQAVQVVAQRLRFGRVTQSQGNGAVEYQGGRSSNWCAARCIATKMALGLGPALAVSMALKPMRASCPGPPLAGSGSGFSQRRAVQGRIEAGFYRPRWRLARSVVCLRAEVLGVRRLYGVTPIARSGSQAYLK